MHQESTRSDVFRKRATKPLLKHEHRQKHRTWAVEKKELNCCSVVQSPLNFQLNLESRSQSLEKERSRHRIHVAWGPVWSFHIQWWFGLPCLSAGVGPLCFLKVHSQRSHIPGNFRALHASFCWQTLWRCWFHFPAGLGICPHCQSTKSWFSDHGVSCLLDWPANSPDLNPIENLDERTPDPNNTDELKAAIKATWASLHLSSATGWSSPCHAALMQ